MSYDDELKSNNYSTPKRCAKALKKYLTDSNSHILDIGCGTGLSGQEILNVGFKNVDGTDFSDKMLYEAKKKSIYKSLFNLDFLISGVVPILNISSLNIVEEIFFV